MLEGRGLCSPERVVLMAVFLSVLECNESGLRKERTDWLIIPFFLNPLENAFSAGAKELDETVLGSAEECSGEITGSWLTGTVSLHCVPSCILG